MNDVSERCDADRVGPFLRLDQLDHDTRHSVIVIFTCFNRRETTLQALRSLSLQELQDWVVGVVVVDDGSADGTANAVEEEFPNVHVERASGNLYWVGGMAVAQSVAMAFAPDHIIWLNDDVVLKPTALGDVLRCALRHDERAVVVGAFTDHDTGECSYSGFRRHGRSPLQVTRLEPSGADQSVDTINGNLAVLPRAVYEVVGNVDTRFVHLGGDIDYGYRAVAAGFPLYLAPSFVGTCRRNFAPLSYADRGEPLLSRLRLVTSPKQIPLSAGITMMRSHGGRFWLVFTLRRYLRAYWTALKGRE